MWSHCYDSVQRVYARNFTLVHKQKELLNSYAKIFSSQKDLWLLYTQSFQEEQADILQRVTVEKTDTFVNSYKKQVSDLTEAMAMVGTSDAQSPYVVVYQVWNGIIVLFMLGLLMVRTFPQHSISQAIIAQWESMLLYGVTFVSRSSKSTK
jgi:hypothetical protein